VANQLVHIGFGNYLTAGRIVGHQRPASAPIQRLIRRAKQARTVIDVTSGRKTRTAVILDSGHIVLLAIGPETFAGRLQAALRGETRTRARAK
jgi:hypothetical protein